VPAWITPRRLGATAALYAVFVAGWYLGQPLPAVGCEAPLSAGAEAATIGEPGEATDTLVQTTERVLTAQVVDRAAIVSCDGEPHARLLAWATGDWR
jgi:hypothetical protein